MKITKHQLKQIIKEELQAVLSEDELDDLRSKSDSFFDEFDAAKQSGGSSLFDDLKSKSTSPLGSSAIKPAGENPDYDEMSRHEQAMYDIESAKLPQGGSGKTSIEYGKLAKDMVPKVRDAFGIKDTDVYRYNGVPMQFKELPPEGVEIVFNDEARAQRMKQK